MKIPDKKLKYENEDIKDKFRGNELVTLNELDSLCIRDILLLSTLSEKILF